MGKIWCDYKSCLTTQIIEAEGDIEAINELKPDGVKSIGKWQQFVSDRLSDQHKAMRQKCQGLRSKQKMPHTTSRMGYAHLEHKMRKESDAPDSISRVDVWIEGHLRKDGKPLNDAVGVAVSQNATVGSQSNAMPIHIPTDLQGCFCEILHWNGSGAVVATGEIVSTDLSALSDDYVAVGPDCWKVWVDDAIDRNCPLYRASLAGKFYLRDAHTSTIVWPKKFVEVLKDL